MPPAPSRSTNPPPDEPLSAAQQRIVDAALELFAEHGVGGTSLQMIADRIGVTKAAIYHQYPTKEEIVLTAAGAELARVEAVVEAGEAETDPLRARDLVVTAIVDLAVERRRMESSLVGDPVIVRYYAHHAPFRRTMERLYRLLMGDDAGPDAQLSAAMLTAAIGGAAMHPMAVDFDDDTLRAGLLRLATRFLDPPIAAATTTPAPSPARSGKAGKAGKTEKATRAGRARSRS